MKIDEFWIRVHTKGWCKHLERPMTPYGCDDNLVKISFFMVIRKVKIICQVYVNFNNLLNKSLLSWVWRQHKRLAYMA